MCAVYCFKSSSSVLKLQGTLSSPHQKNLNARLFPVK